METKRAKTIMLPTKENGKIHFHLNKLTTKPMMRASLKDDHTFVVSTPQHLYITTDDEIKKGDWCYDEKAKVVFQFKHFFFYGVLNSNNHSQFERYCKKIIATTDPKLIEGIYKELLNPNREISIEGLPQPSQAFIEKYCKVGGIDEVMVEYIKEDILDNQGICWDTEEHLKINSYNEITIHPIKNSWTKEEIINYTKDFAEDIILHTTDASNNNLLTFIDELEEKL